MDVYIKQFIAINSPKVFQLIIVVVVQVYLFTDLKISPVLNEDDAQSLMGDHAAIDDELFCITITSTHDMIESCDCN